MTVLLSHMKWRFSTLRLFAHNCTAHKQFLNISRGLFYAKNVKNTHLDQSILKSLYSLAENNNPKNFNMKRLYTFWWSLNGLVDKFSSNRTLFLCAMLRAFSWIWFSFTLNLNLKTKSRSMIYYILMCIPKINIAIKGFCVTLSYKILLLTWDTGGRPTTG